MIITLDKANEILMDGLDWECPVCKYAEKLFDDWIECQNSEVHEQYFSDEAISTKRGALLEIIEQARELMEEDDKTKINMDELDIDAACRP